MDKHFNWMHFSLPLPLSHTHTHTCTRVRTFVNVNSFCSLLYISRPIYSTLGGLEVKLGWSAALDSPNCREMHFFQLWQHNMAEKNTLSLFPGQVVWTAPHTRTQTHAHALGDTHTVALAAMTFLWPLCTQLTGLFAANSTALVRRRPLAITLRISK